MARGEDVTMKRVFVHRYKWSHDKRRNQLRRLKKNGAARVIESLPDGWVYEIPKDFPVAPTR